MRFSVQVRIVAVVSLVLLLLWGNYRSGQKQKVLSCAFLQTNWENAVAEIEFAYNGTELTLYRTPAGWQCIASPNCMIPADSGRITLLLSALSKERLLYPISHDVSLLNDFGLIDESFLITIRSAGGAVISEVYFGKKCADGVSVYVRSGNSLTAFSVLDDFASFRTLALRAWCRMELTDLLQQPDVVKNVQYIAVHTLSSQLYTIQRTSGSFWNLAYDATTVPVADWIIHDYLVHLASARGIDVQAVSDLAIYPIASITIIDGTATTRTFKLSSIPNLDDSFFFYQENESFGYYISNWTTNRLFPDPVTFLK